MSTLAGLVATAVTNAENSTSQLTAELLGMKGLTGLLVRHLCNNLAAMPNTTALFVQPGTGDGLCSALIGNSVTVVTVNDVTTYPTNMQALAANVDLFKGSNTVTLNDVDWNSLDISGLPTFNVFVYHGSNEATRVNSALTRYLPLLANEFVVVINDWSTPQTRDSINRFVIDNGMTVEYSKDEGELHEGGDPTVAAAAGWWTGVHVDLLKKSRFQY
jgi:hypothetical protein